MRASAVKRGFFVGALGLWIVSCAGPDPDRAGYVVVDESARRAGLTVSVDGIAAEGRVPTAVEPGDEVVLTGEGGREESLMVAPGELVEVTGVNGVIRRGRADRDQLRVVGPETSARELAEMLGAESVAVGPGQWMLRGKGILPVVTMFDLPAGLAIDGVLADDPATSVARAALWHQASLEGAAVVDDAVGDAVPEVALAPSADLASLVGVYAAGGGRLVVDAMGGFLLCTPSTGALRGRAVLRGSELALVSDSDHVATIALSVLANGNLRDATGLVLSPMEAPQP